MNVVGIVGHPIGHSASPKMHNAVYAHLNLDYTYVPFDVVPETLEQAVKGLRALQVSGVNVTVPLKERIIPFLDELDGEAKTIGAVNTVLNKNGRLIGYNTDGLGFIFSLKECHQFDFSSKRVVVIGAGGTAKAIVTKCMVEPMASLTVINRNLSRAQSLLSSDFISSSQVSYQLLSSTDEAVHDALCEADLIINTTPLGMPPMEDKMPLASMQWVQPHQICYDVIYVPNPTLFLREAQNKGATIISGSEMLAAQAKFAFKIFTGHDASFKMMHDVLIGRV